jgi:hypothetical protein
MLFYYGNFHQHAVVITRVILVVNVSVFKRSACNDILRSDFMYLNVIFASNRGNVLERNVQ